MEKYIKQYFRTLFSVIKFGTKAYIYLFGFITIAVCWTTKGMSAGIFFGIFYFVFYVIFKRMFKNAIANAKKKAMDKSTQTI